MSFLGRKLKELREHVGISQTELSKLTGISNVYISNIENGIKKNPSMELIQKIADALGVSINEFFSNEKPIDEINKMVKDNGINTIAAHFEGEEFTEDDKEDIKNFIEYILSKKKNK